MRARPGGGGRPMWAWDMCGPGRLRAERCRELGPDARKLETVGDGRVKKCGSSPHRAPRTLLRRAVARSFPSERRSRVICEKRQHERLPVLAGDLVVLAAQQLEDAWRHARQPALAAHHPRRRRARERERADGEGEGHFRR